LVAGKLPDPNDPVCPDPIYASRTLSLAAGAVGVWLV